jgi:hypothetical protein
MRYVTVMRLSEQTGKGDGNHAMYSSGCNGTKLIRYIEVRNHMGEKDIAASRKPLKLRESILGYPNNPFHAS